MSLKDARQVLMDALTLAGINTFYGSQPFSAPCVRIYAADPWVALSGLANGRRTQGWEIWCVGGKTDGEGNFDEVENLVQIAHEAMRGLPGWSEPIWRRPGVTPMGGVSYLACKGVIETTAEV